MEPLYDRSAMERVGGVPLLLSVSSSSCLAETVTESVQQVRQLRAQLVAAATRLVQRPVPSLSPAGPLGRVSLGCRVLDEVIGGGGDSGGCVARGSVTEIAGESGAGKTQLCLQMLVQCCAGSSEARAVYVSTEGAVATHRLVQMCRARGLPDQLLDRVLVYSAVEVDELLALVQRRLPPLAVALSGALRLLVVDSVASPFRASHDTTTGDGLSGGGGQRRAEHLQALGAALRALSMQHSVAVLCVNQATACLAGGGGAGGSSRAALGLAWASQLNTRLWVARTEQSVIGASGAGPVEGSSQRRLMVMRVVFSPYLPPATGHYYINDSGAQGIVI